MSNLCQLEQVDTFPYQRYHGSLITGAGDRCITAENMDKLQYTDFNEDTTNEGASVACSNVRL